LTELAYGLVSYLSDVHAVKTVPFASCIMGHPVNFKWSDIVKYRIIIFLSYFRGNVGDFLRNWIIGNRVTRRFVPWMFNTVRVASYEAYTNRMESKFGTGLTTRFNRQQFPTPTSPVVSCVAGRGQYGPCENAGQRVNINGNARIEHCPETVTAPVAPVLGEPAVCDDARSEGGDAPPEPVVVAVEPAVVGGGEGEVAHELPVGAEGREGSTDGQFEGRGCRRIRVVQADLNMPVQRDECDAIIEPVLPPGTIVSCEIAAGLITSFTITTQSGQVTNHRFETNVAASLRNNAVEAEQLCTSITKVLRHLEGRQTGRINYWAILNWAVRFIAHPHGRSGDKSVVPKGYGLLPLVPPAVIPGGFKTFAVGNLGLAVSEGAPSVVEQGERTRGTHRSFQARRSGEVLFEGRNQRQGRRPA